MSKLANKVALVTGGSRGIGAAIAKRLAADGANVAFTYAKDASAAAAQRMRRLRMARRGARRAAEDALGTKAANVIRRTQIVAQAEQALIRSGLFTSVRVVAPPASTAPAPITWADYDVKASQSSSKREFPLRVVAAWSLTRREGLQSAFAA